MFCWPPSPTSQETNFIIHLKILKILSKKIIILLFQLIHWCSQWMLSPCIQIFIITKELLQWKRNIFVVTQKNIITKSIATFLAVILTLNQLKFNSKFYLQMKVCAMETIRSPLISEYIHGRNRKDAFLFSKQKQIHYVYTLHRRYSYDVDYLQSKV